MMKKTLLEQYRFGVQMTAAAAAVAVALSLLLLLLSLLLLPAWGHPCWLLLLLLLLLHRLSWLLWQALQLWSVFSLSALGLRFGPMTKLQQQRLWTKRQAVPPAWMVPESWALWRPVHCRGWRGWRQTAHAAACL